MLNWFKNLFKRKEVIVEQSVVKEPLHYAVVSIHEIADTVKPRIEEANRKAMIKAWIENAKLVDDYFARQYA